MSLTRRDLLALTMLGGATVALPLEATFGTPVNQRNRIAASALPAPFTVPLSVPPTLVPVRSDDTTDYYQVTMRPTTAEIVPGLATPLWGYEGVVPGPTFRVQQGRKVVARFVNELPTRHPVWGYAPWTSVHLHGSASLPQYDGYASDITNPGQWKDYRYPNWQNARTLWYHDHGVHHTAENVYMGLAGLYLLSDAREQSLPLPKGEFDVPLVVSDRMFNADGSLLFSVYDGKGVWGDVITVNGRAWPVMKVKRRKYRFRILNASISRSYRWSFTDGTPMTVIATDAGLVPQPRTLRGFRHGSAERYEVVVDFSRHRPGQRVVLRNTSPAQNVDYPGIENVMAFDVVGDPFPTSANAVPGQLFDHPAMTVPESASVRTRRMELVRSGGLWTINGTTWDDVVRSGFRKVLADPTIDDVEVWEIVNDSGGWFHPMHIHFVDFKVLTRNGRPAAAHECGAKDVVYVGPNETVRVLIKFERGRGRYMMHCHNLVHEDHDMMGQFEIKDPSTAAPDPLSEPCDWLPAGPL